MDLLLEIDRAKINSLLLDFHWIPWASVFIEMMIFLPTLCQTSCPSVRLSVKIEGGGGKSQKRFCNSFFGMKLLWDDINNIS